ncbi:MAG: hypothetical protein ACRERY_01220 [Pseudomonas sp.]
MRNSISYIAVLAAIITLGTVSTGFAEQSGAMAQRNSGMNSGGMMKGDDMHMMEGNKMPMMDMMQEMTSMMKSCNEMMQNMNKHMGMGMGNEAAQGDSKTAQ